MEDAHSPPAIILITQLEIQPSAPMMVVLDACLGSLLKLPWSFAKTKQNWLV